MKQYQNVIIGFGKAGKTLAGGLAKAGQSVALVERSAAMYGGTCINVACIPTKSLENSARLSAAQGGGFEEKAERYREAVAEKRRLTGMLRQKNYDKVASAGAVIYTGLASFEDAHHIRVTLADGGEEILEAERIFINTGARPNIPRIEGVEGNRFVYTSETLMEREELPRHLVILGGGYIGLEFASYFANFGSQVTIVQRDAAFIPREDAEIAEAVLKSLTDRGITVLRAAKTLAVRERADGVDVVLEVQNAEKVLRADAVLAATGRRPNLEGLVPEKAGLEITDRGAIRTDEHLRTNVPHIWAMGDVAGGQQFTYISLDDFRIVKAQLLGDGRHTTENRGPVPYSVFLDPPFSRVGMTEAEAAAKGFDVRVARLPAAAIPKAQVLKKPVGFLKAVVDGKTGLILGAHLFCAESHEMINLVKLAMEAGIPYTALRDGIFTHPTMSEGLNDLFGTL
ncbi:MAG: FAD-dependent oxidoreductase [Clostridiales bacterium]|nr:FAD-dependent oxidoreductase [Clostridiales bacterium]